MQFSCARLQISDVIRLDSRLLSRRITSLICSLKYLTQ